MEVSEILAQVNIMLSERPVLTISSLAPAVRLDRAQLLGSNTVNQLIVSPLRLLPDAFVKRTRVTFLLGPDSHGREVHGSGIAIRYEDDPQRVKVAPYRLTLVSKSSGAIGGQTVELRQNAWRFRAQTRPVGAIAFWLRAARTVSLPLSVLPICIGASLGFLHGRFDLVLFALSLGGGVAAHLGTNLFSDYFDFVKGIDTTNALSSHTGVLVDELIEPQGILAAGLVCFMITALAGGALIALSGWPILLFGLAGMAGGFMYTGGPFAWKYLGLGEFATGLLMGPLMLTGACYVQTGFVGLPAILLSVAVGMLVSAVSLANNIRDAALDASSGFNTMPAKAGAGPAKLAFRALVLCPFVFLALVCILDLRLLPVLAAFLVLPFAVSLAWRFGRGAVDLPALSAQAGSMILPLRIIKVHLWFCLLALAGCVCGAIMNG